MLRKPNREIEYICKCGSKFYLKKRMSYVLICKQCHKNINNEKSRKSKYYKREKYREKNHNWMLKTKYGINKDVYNQILKQQNGVCAICKNIDSCHRFSVDHNHTNGNIRGLFCHRCNRVIGSLKEDPELFKSCLSYLIQHGEYKNYVNK